MLTLACYRAIRSVADSRPDHFFFVNTCLRAGLFGFYTYRLIHLVLADRVGSILPVDRGLETCLRRYSTGGFIP